jgi:hypothetical protein
VQHLPIICYGFAAWLHGCITIHSSAWKFVPHLQIQKI